MWEPLGGKSKLNKRKYVYNMLIAKCKKSTAHKVFAYMFRIKLSCTNTEGLLMQTVDKSHALKWRKAPVGFCNTELSISIQM